MNHIERVNQVIKYIEEHIHEELVVSDIADQSGLSRWEFQRLFRATTQHSVGEYIRRRRLTLASDRLRNPEERILDIAIDLQFGSQEAFSRAFKKMFDLSPGQFRSEPHKIKTQKRIQLTPEMIEHLSQGLEKEPQISDIGPFKLIGAKTEIKNHLAPNSDYERTLIPFWEQFLTRVPDIRNRKGDRFFGVALTSTFSIEDENLKYMAAVEVEDFSDIPPGMFSYEIPRAKYAQFTKVGAWKETSYAVNYIYGTWLPNSNYHRFNNGDDFEIFDTRYRLHDPSSISEYILPISDISLK